MGISPLVRVTDAGPQKEPDLGTPWRLRSRSRITLVATEHDQACVAEASFYIDKTLTDCARAGDEINLSRHANCGLGFSLIREGKLLAAAGVLTAVPLGIGVEVRIPDDLISTAQSVFQKRDPDFKFLEQPVEIKIDGLRERYCQFETQSASVPLTETFISFGGSAIIGDYRVIVRRGSPRGMFGGGRGESVSICDKQMFTHAAGAFAAMLLDDPEAPLMSRWDGKRH